MPKEGMNHLSVTVYTLTCSNQSYILSCSSLTYKLIQTKLIKSICKLEFLTFPSWIHIATFRLGLWELTLTCGYSKWSNSQPASKTSAVPRTNHHERPILFRPSHLCNKDVCPDQGADAAHSPVASLHLTVDVSPFHLSTAFILLPFLPLCSTAICQFA